MAWSRATRGSSCGPPLARKSISLLRFPTQPKAFLVLALRDPRLASDIPITSLPYKAMGCRARAILARMGLQRFRCEMR
eukprot:5468665-Amphidinium_carterae.1